MLVYQQDRIIPVSTADIALLHLAGGAVQLRTFDGHHFVLDQSLDEFKSALTARFFRVNRQFTLHRPAVRDAAQYFQRKLLVNLTIGPATEPILVSKEKASAFLHWLAMT